MTEDPEADKEHGRDSEAKAEKGEGSLPRPTDQPISPENGIEGIFVNKDAGLIAGESLENVGASTGVHSAPLASPRPKREATGKSAFLVGAGILISRIIGVVRQRVFAYYLGTSDAAGGFSAAFRIP